MILYAERKLLPQKSFLQKVYPKIIEDNFIVSEANNLSQKV